MEWRTTDGINTERIPNDVYSIIASFLEPKDLCSFGLVCREFYEIFEREELWEVFFNIKDKRSYARYSINDKPGHVACTYKEAVILEITERVYICAKCYNKINRKGSKRARQALEIDDTKIKIYVCSTCRKNIKPVRSLTELTEDEKKRLTQYKRYGQIRYDLCEIRRIVSERYTHEQDRNYRIAAKTVSVIKRKLIYRDELKKTLQQVHNIPEQDAKHIVNNSEFEITGNVTSHAIELAKEYQKAKQEIAALKQSLGVEYTFEELLQLHKHYRRNYYCSSGSSFEYLVKRIKQDDAKQRSEEVKKQALEELKNQVENGFDNLPPLCKSLFTQFDNIKDMIPREEYLMNKVTKLGFIYSRLDFCKPRVAEYIQGSNYATIDDIIHELLSDHIKGQVTTMTRMAHMSIHDRIQVLKLLKNRNNWEAEKIVEFDQTLAGIEMIAKTCKGLLPEHKNKINYQFTVNAMTFVEKGLQTMVDGVIETLNYSAALHDAIDEYISTGEDRLAYLNRKAIEFEERIPKAQRGKRKRGEDEEIESGDETESDDDSQPEEDDRIAKRVKTTKRAVSRFS
jgi:DNA-directed RNA polymerase subunit RPC12/RpoP